MGSPQGILESVEGKLGRKIWKVECTYLSGRCKGYLSRLGLHRPYIIPPGFGKPQLPYTRRQRVRVGLVGHQDVHMVFLLYMDR